MVQLINNTVDTIFMDDEKKFYWNLYNNLLNKFIKYLKENENEITHYSSCIISQNYQTVFNHLINLNNAATFGKYFAKKFEYKGREIKKGTFIKGINDDNETIYLRINKYENDNNSNILKFCFQTFGTNSKLARQEIEMNVIKINNNFCQLSILHTFLQCVSKEVMKELDKRKKQYFFFLKEYFQKRD